MTSLREAIARLFRSQQAEPDLPDPDFDYRVFWTEQAMAWPQERRKKVLLAIQSLRRQADFSPVQSERRYRLDELEEERYSSASLVALETVLNVILDKQKDESINE